MKFVANLKPLSMHDRNLIVCRTEFSSFVDFLIVYQWLIETLESLFFFDGLMNIFLFFSSHLNHKNIHLFYFVLRAWGSSVARFSPFFRLLVQAIQENVISSLIHVHHPSHSCVGWTYSDNIRIKGSENFHENPFYTLFKGFFPISIY